MNAELGSNAGGWGLHFDAGTTSILRAGVQQWATARTEAPSASHRLQRIRKAQRLTEPQAAPAGVRVWQSRPEKATRVWVLAGAAAVLALAILAGWVLQQSAEQPEPTVVEQPALPQHKPSEKQLQPQPPSAALMAAELPADAKGLYVLPTPSEEANWIASTLRPACPPGALMQLAANAHPVEFTVFGSHRIKLLPGTLARLSGDTARPQVDIWRGRAEITGGDRPLYLGTLADQGARRDLATVLPGLRWKVETAQLKTPAFERDGFSLVDARAVKPVACTAAEVKPDDAIALQPGTANLLIVIDGGFANVEVTEIAQALQNLLNVEIRLSPAAQKTVGGKAVTLNLGQVTGAEALSALATQTGLVLQIRDGAVVLGLPGEEPQPESRPRDEEF